MAGWEILYKLYSWENHPAGDFQASIFHDTEG
jgi:hypothetical protein